MKLKILFVSEAVSLAHVARPSVLATALDTGKFELHFASNGQFSFCYADRSLSLHRIDSILPQEFLRRLSSGRPLYSYAELDAYVQEDMALISAVKPDVIVSDFRLSMSISARRAGVALLAICNSHWSPYAARGRMCAPDFPMVRLIGSRLFDSIFRLAWPVASRWHVMAANRLRERYHLAPYASLNEFYCDGDVSMYADSPALGPLRDAPDSHTFIGPIVWSPSIPLPRWWPEVAERADPPVYITMGSTGKADLLPQIVDACRSEKICCMVSTAGRSGFRTAPPDVYVEAFLPGDRAAALSSLVICNGGSATAHQALSQGRPVLGICSNLDQVMTMQGIAAAGAGEFLRATEATLPRLRETLRRMHANESFARGARAIQASFALLDPCQRFSRIVENELRERGLSS